SALDGLLAAVAAGGLRAVAVDLVPFALVRALTDPAAGRPAAAEPGDGDPDGPNPPEPAPPAVEPEVVVHEGGRPRFVRTVAVGGDLLTAAVGDELGVDADTAESAKRAGASLETLGADGPDGDLARRAARVVELRL